MHFGAKKAECLVTRIWAASSILKLHSRCAVLLARGIVLDPAL